MPVATGIYIEFVAQITSVNRLTTCLSAKCLQKASVLKVVRFTKVGIPKSCVALCCALDEVCDRGCPRQLWSLLVKFGAPKLGAS